MRGWCPKCQKITEHLIEETMLLKQETCLECQTPLHKIIKEVKDENGVRH